MEILGFGYFRCEVTKRIKIVIPVTKRNRFGSHQPKLKKPWMAQNARAMPPATVVKVDEITNNAKLPLPFIPMKPVSDAVMSSGRKDQFHARTLGSS